MRSCLSLESTVIFVDYARIARLSTIVTAVAFPIFLDPFPTNAGKFLLVPPNDDDKLAAAYFVIALPGTLSP